MARTPHLILGSAAPPRPAAKLRSAGPTVWPSHRQSWTGPSHDRTAGTSPPTGACWDLKSTHHYTVTLDLNQLSLHEQPFFSAVSLYASFLIWASACASWYNTWFHWFVNSHIESFPPSLALKYLLLKIFTAGQISKKKKKREITWTFTVPENKVQYHWQRVQFFIQSPKTLETTHIPFSCTFWLNPCGSNCPHMWAEQMNSKRCEIHNHKRLNRPSQTLHESILRTPTNTLWFVLFLTSLTTAQVHFLPQTLTWLFTSSQSLYNAPCFLTSSQRVADFWVSLFYCRVSDLAQKFHGDPHLQAALIV